MKYLIFGTKSLVVYDRVDTFAAAEEYKNSHPNVEILPLTIAIQEMVTIKK